MRLFQLVYISKSDTPADTDVLEAIRKSAVRNNSANNITGLLLHSHGHFMQILEGHCTNVAATFDRICEDSRHAEIQCVYFAPTRERIYPDWNMGVYDLNSGNGAEIGVDVVKVFGDARKNGVDALRREDIIIAFERFRTKVTAAAIDTDLRASA